MKNKRNLIIVIAVIILLTAANEIFSIRIPFLSDSAFGDFLGKAAAIYSPILPAYLLKLNYQEWKRGMIDTLGLCIFSVLFGVAFILFAVVSAGIIASIK